MLKDSLYYRNTAYFFASCCAVLIILIVILLIVIIRQQDKIAFQDKILINYPTHIDCQSHRKSWKREYFINRNRLKHR